MRHCARKWASALRAILLVAGLMMVTNFGAQADVIFTSLYSFTGGNDGLTPEAGLFQGSDGYFYGTTVAGGGSGSTYYGDGTVFKIGTNGALITLYAFTGSDGNSPEAGLVQGSDGEFYGTTYLGGDSSAGNVFQISAQGALTNLCSFGSPGGILPAAPVIQASDGYLYGTTYAGGSPNEGTLFKLSTNGALTTLRSFTNGSDGAYPKTALVQGADGYLYGIAEASVFKVSTNGAFSPFYSFTGDNGMINALVLGRDGQFYGSTYGGSYTSGSVFKLSAVGVLTNLHSFSGRDGLNPAAGLVQGADGYLYGTTYYGGTNGNNGSVFRISTNGLFSSLYSFSGNDGGFPEAPLMQGRDGWFYGTTRSGGSNGFGTVFRFYYAPSVPVFQAATVTNGELSLVWSAEIGTRYQLQFISNPRSTNWSNLGSVLTATGATLSASDSITNGPSRFYRVVLLP